MSKTGIGISLITAVAIVTAALAQTTPSFEKKNYNYSEWAKGRFSEAVTVSFAGPAKLIFLAGVGAEDENGKPGDIRHKDDFTAQCKYAYDKIKRALDKNGAGLGDIVKIVSYVRTCGFRRITVAVVRRFSARRRRPPTRCSMWCN